MRSVRIAALGITLLSLLLTGTAAAGTTLITEKVTRGPVHAELSYLQRSSGGYEGMRIRIERKGTTLVDRSVTISGCGGCDVWPLVAHHALRVRNLDRNPGYEVLLRLYTGGAHCCGYDRVYKYDRSLGDYRARSHDFGNALPRIVDLDGDGRVEFRSADNRFFYAFTAFAFSGAPIQVWRFADGRFANVTRHERFRPAVHRNARRWWREYRKVRGGSTPDVRGILAAWTADRYLLHRGTDAWATLRRIERRGELDVGDFGPRGKTYLHKLRRFLTKTGYIR